MKHEQRHEQAPDPHDLDRNLRLEESAITTELDHLRANGDEDTDGFLLDRLTEILEDIADEDKMVRIYIGQEQAGGIDSRFFRNSYLLIKDLSWGTYTTTNEEEIGEGIILHLGVNDRVLPLPLQRIGKIRPLCDFPK